MTTVSVTLHNGQVISFEADATRQDTGTSYAVDGVGVLTIESKETMNGLTVTRQQRFSPAAWHSIEEVDTVDALCRTVVGSADYRVFVAGQARP